MDATTLRPQLPALSYLDMDKTKHEEDAYQSRNAGVQQPAIFPSPVVASSPTQQYPPGPPPPYSHPAPPLQQHANNPSGLQSGLGTRPESRRLTGEEKDAAKQPLRQSLPSISEALGVDNQGAYQTTLPAPASIATPSAMQAPQPSSAARSSPSPTRRSFGMDPARLLHERPYLGHSSYARPVPPQSQAPPEPSRYAFADPRPSLNVQTSRSPRSQQSDSYGFPPVNPSPAHDQPQPQPPSQSATMAPPTFPYGYTPYPPRYAQPPASSSASAGPIYQPSSVHGMPLTPSSTWKAEAGASRHGADESHYGDSVKRHLDLYDLEAALNDISSASGYLGDFARRYGDRLHQTSRTGPSLSTLPGIVEAEDMIAKSRRQTEALIKIREVVLNQQAAYDQQVAEQREHKPFAEAAGPAAAAAAPRSPIDSDDAKADLAGSDAKKRRGRAAPPGRCHSCNRAETPEWRRGPDGARTLCNACGLHYAKLTRKQNNANKAAAVVGSSNLRPKESLQESLP